ncbi:MAG TPA: hypothetical protein VHQ47_18025, partial [Phycisphaerae bacterium]|nr:hypothetical protein [Phycisphaerae bacterium]
TVTCPVSISRSIATICSSVNRFFIRLPAFPGWEVYMIQWRHFRGAGQEQMGPVACAEFDEIADAEDRALRVRDAFEWVDDLLKRLGF